MLLNDSISLPPEEIEVLLSAFPEGIAALDLETTGLSPTKDKIVEIAAVKLTKDGQLEVFSSLVNPGIPIPIKNQAIHHISDEMVKDAPYIQALLRDFKKFIGNTTLVAHNAKFDTGFIVYAYHASDEELNSLAVYDSVRMARSLYKDVQDLKEEKDDKPDNFKLGTLAQFFEVKIESEHRALDDAFACLRVFAKSIDKLKKINLPLAVKHRAYIYNLEDFKRLKEYDLPEKLKSIYESINSDSFITIDYRGGTNPGGARKVKPLAFLPMPTGVFLYAKCLETNLYKHYAVKKIKSVSP